MHRITPIFLALILTACGTAKTVVLEPVDTTNKFSQVKLVEENPTVNVQPKVTELFRSVIEKGLYEEGPFTLGSELRIVYTFVGVDEGDQFARWFWGGIGNAGEGTITIRVRYLDDQDKELTNTQVEGRIGSGFFGGSFDEAITKAGEEIVKFTIENFN
jgi:hypothetical protein